VKNPIFGNFKQLSPHKWNWLFYIKLPPYALVGFDLTTHSSNLIGGDTTRPRCQGKIGVLIWTTNDVVKFSHKSSILRHIDNFFTIFFRKNIFEAIPLNKMPHS
jgi:hypothetical protein